MKYGAAPDLVSSFKDVDLREVMYYLYLPVRMPGTEERLPSNLQCLRDMTETALGFAGHCLGRRVKEDYVYVSARKGWATPDNPLNRPGWHCDGFGTDDLNFVWWRGPGTRFALGDFGAVPADHHESMAHFEKATRWAYNAEMAARMGFPDVRVKEDYLEAHMYAIDPSVVHATPVIETPCWRQYVKISLSRHKYNLENNSHNYLFSYKWPMHSREEVRNDTFKAQRDFA